MYEKIKHWLADNKNIHISKSITITETTLIELIGTFAREQCKLQQQADIEIAKYYIPKKKEHEEYRRARKKTTHAIANKIASGKLVIDEEEFIEEEMIEQIDGTEEEREREVIDHGTAEEIEEYFNPDDKKEIKGE